MGQRIVRPNARSQAAFRKAKRLMPGGVSSPVRAFDAVGGSPLFIRSAEGCTITDVDANNYIDYVASFGPIIVAHANERVVAAMSKAVGRGSTYGAPTEAETQLAAVIVSAMPSVEMVRFVNSGTEAVMSALRLARAATGRELVVKCIGCYHGHADAMLVEAGSGALTLGVPSSPGVSPAVAAQTLVVPYNDLPAAQKLLAESGPRIACFIVEPVAGNMGVVAPADGYLAGLRALCDKHGALLILDEVMTGFRVAWGGAQVLYNVRPDLTCLGKIIGGGLPVGALGGPRKLMERLAPAGDVYQAGTLSGNPVAMAAGLATLEILQEGGAYATLEGRSSELANGLGAAAQLAGVRVAVNRVGSMLGLFFLPKELTSVRSCTDVRACSKEAYAVFFHAMLDNGVYLAPSPYEAIFVSLAHTTEVIQQTILAARAAFTAVAAKGKA